MQKTIVIAAGGTGGHVFPALAVAQELRHHDVNVLWLGCATGIEARLVPQAEIKLKFIPVRGLRKAGLVYKLKTIIYTMQAILLSYKILRQIKPDLVLGMGGYVAGPVGIAAKLSFTPLLIHEQNSIAGFTNRVLAKLATRVMTSYPDTKKLNVKNILTGNPIRKSLLSLKDSTAQSKGENSKLNILVFGGSLGAMVFNDVVPAALAQIPENLRPDVWHQTGQRHYDVTKQNYNKYNVHANLAKFIDDMAAAYEWADLVIARSGALTVSEIAAVGVASILVPYPYAVDDHQTQNAQYLSHINASVCIAQKNFTADKLQEILFDLNMQREQLAVMAACARKFAKKDATILVAKNCLEVMTNAAV